MAKITKKIILKYTILQIPGLGLITLILYILSFFISIAQYVHIIILSIWIVKDIVMFPFVWRSFDSSSSDITRVMIGKTGTAKQDVHSEGYVIIGSEQWKAVPDATSATINKHDNIQVTDINGLTVTIKRID